ncbi:hypothetical protein BaRGS_00038295 [Batillaria attramentaria]|uniref:Uncharacterized protein n=1 Tax=Batillaria attramentaria TaxID=370345 RepID=A0ABD0J7Q0_9CAEN
MTSPIRKLEEKKQRKTQALTIPFCGGSRHFSRVSILAFFPQARKKIVALQKTISGVRSSNKSLYSWRTNAKGASLYADPGTRFLERLRADDGGEQVQSRQRQQRCGRPPVQSVHGGLGCGHARS